MNGPSPRGMLGVLALLSALAAVVIAPVSAAPGPRAAGETFPGENGLWAFSASVFDQPEAIYVGRSGQSGGSRLAQGHGPEWSPNGRRIAFERGGAVHVMRTDGTAVGRLATNATDPAWSPDGSRIAFARNGHLWVMQADGSAQVRLTDTTDNDAEPSWSPDGSELAFSSDRSGRRHLFVMDAGGSGITQITSGATTDETSPDWSPDGTMLAFIGEGVEVVGADGTGRTTLSAASRTLWHSPSWSPDGTRVAFALDTTFDGSGLAAVNADGSGYAETGFNGQDYGTVDWQGVRTLDTGPPKIDFLTPPGPGEVYARHSLHYAHFACTDPSGILSCTAEITKPDGRTKTVVNGSRLPTPEPGRYRLAVTGTDGALNTRTARVAYRVTG